MAGVVGALRLLLGLALLGAGGADAGGDESLGQAVAELESLVRAQRARLDTLEAQVGHLPAERRLSLVGGKSIYAGGSGSYTSAENFGGSMDHIWLIFSAVLVLFMQAGFAMLEAGSCRGRNVQNVLMKNLFDVCVSTVGWWIVGWAFAFSGPYVGRYKENGFLGWYEFAGHTFVSTRGDGQQEPTTKIVRWFSTWAYCCVASTVATNGLAERSSFLGYFIFTLLFSSVVYPMVVAWTWGGGWLSDLNKTGFFDYAGSGVVHLSGGIAALVGAAIAGPRKGRFEGQSGRNRLKDPPADFAANSPPLLVLGTFILWFGWYGFLFGRTLEMNTYEKGMMAALTAMNATLAASAGGIVAYIFGLALKRTDIGVFCNGVLAGLVSISASAVNVENGTAFGIGAGGALAYIVSSSLLRLAKVDDPIDSFSVHGACGMWGVLAAAILDWGKDFSVFHGFSGFRCMPSVAVSCDTSLGVDPILANLSEIGAILGWVGGVSCIIFLILKLARCIRDDEEQGWDDKAHVPARGFDLEDVLPKTSL